MTNKEIIQNLYQNFSTGDVPAVLAAFADDICWTESDGFPTAGTYIGPQAVLENVFMPLGDLGANWRVEVARYVAEGNTVVADGVYRWEHKETDTPCVVRMAHIWTLADGKITKFLQHVDSANVLEQLA